MADAPTGMNVPVTYLAPGGDMQPYNSFDEAQAANPGLMVVSSGFASGNTGSQQANPWTSLSGQGYGANGALPTDANVTSWTRQADTSSSWKELLPFALMMASAVGGQFFGAAGAAGGPVEPWMGADAAVETGGSALANSYTPAAATVAEPWMGDTPTVETGGVATPGGGTVPLEPWMGGEPTVETGGGGTLGGGVPVREAVISRLGVNPNVGGGVGSDLSAIVKSVLGIGGAAGGGSASGGGILPLLSGASGAYGLYQAEQLRKLAKAGQMNIPGAPGGPPATSAATTASIAQADPWGAAGPNGAPSGRTIAGDKLKTLLSDPSSITTMPGYEAGLEAVQRSMAAQGYVGSGNMMAALSKYGGDFYNNAVNQLSQLGAATQNPATTANLNLSADQLGITGATAGAKLGLEGNIAANDLTGKALGNLGYAATGAGNNASILSDPRFQALLRSMGAIG